jgi:hypothetical protein
MNTPRNADVVGLGRDLCRQAGRTINLAIKGLGGTPLLSDFETGRLSYRVRNQRAHEIGDARRFFIRLASATKGKGT